MDVTKYYLLCHEVTNYCILVHGCVENLKNTGVQERSNWMPDDFFHVFIFQDDRHGQLARLAWLPKVIRTSKASHGDIQLLSCVDSSEAWYSYKQNTF